MTRLAFIHYTDVHLRSTNPPSRLGNYKQDLLDKMSQIMELGRKHKVDFTTCGGDLFDPKKPSATKHSLVVETTEVYNKLDVPHYIVPGNHDMEHDRMDTLPNQPLGVLLEAGTLRQIIDQEIVKGDLKIKLWSYPFNEEPDFEPMIVDPASDVDVNILGIHVYSSMRGGSLYGNTKIFSYPEMAVTGHDIYLLGHYHADNGAQFLKDQLFVNVGSVARGDYGDENLKRKPKCCLVEILKDKDGKTSIHHTEIELEVKPPEEAFDLEKKEKLKKQKEETAEFVEELQKAVALPSEEREGDRVTVELTSLASDKELFDCTMEYINRGQELAAKKGRT